MDFDSSHVLTICQNLVTVELDENEKIPNLDKYDPMIVMGGPMDTWQEET